jgi:hypothetical protein
LRSASILIAAATVLLVGIPGVAQAITTTTFDDAGPWNSAGTVSYSAGWLTSTGSGKYSGADHYSNTAGAAATMTFRGTAVRLYGAVAPWHGMAAFSVDGGSEKVVDLYSASRADQRLLFQAAGLTPGTHSIRERVVGSANPSSTGTVVTLDRFDVDVVPPAAGSLVTRAGSRLIMAGKPFRFTGANLYWLGLDDNIRDSAGAPTYPTKFRIDNALQAAAAAGMTVIRSHTLGISVGCARCLEPSLGVFQDSALASADYAIARAGQLGLKIIIPLTDQWHFYHGGESTFTGWRGYPNAAGSDNNQINAANNATQRASEAHFYSDPVVIGDFKAYITHLLNHVNPYTGLKYKDDPAVLAWETGNEIWTANTSWTGDIAHFIKHDLGATQLVADGTAADGMHVANAAINAADVDIVGGHFYPVDTSWASADAATAAAAGKVYLIGEYAWTDPVATEQLLTLVDSTTAIAGALLWTLMPFQEDGSPEIHGDGYAFYNPPTNSTMSTVLDTVKRHAAILQGG